ncbi:PPE domain-containing protein [Nocardia takedensis]
MSTDTAAPPETPPETPADTTVTSDWPPLLEAANTGLLKFDEKVVKDATAAAAQLIVNLEALAEEVYTNGLHRMGAFSLLQSSRELAQGYSKHGAALYDGLIAHRDMVQEQYETFVAAGKAFSAAEVDSSVNFDKLNPDYAARPADSTTVEAHSGGKSYGVLPAFPGQSFGGATDTITVTIENAENLSFEQLKDFGISINAAPALTAAGTWQWIARELTTSLQEYADKIFELRNEWEGDSADQAVEAVKKYKHDSSDFIEAVDATGLSLDYTSQWLQITKWEMPPIHVSKKPTACSDRTGKYRQRFKNYYEEGMKRTLTAIPAIVLPGTKTASDVNAPGGGPDGGIGTTNDPNDPKSHIWSPFDPANPNGYNYDPNYNPFGNQNGGYDPYGQYGDPYGLTQPALPGGYSPGEIPRSPNEDVTGGGPGSPGGGEQGGAGDQAGLEQAYQQGYDAGYQEGSTSQLASAGQEALQGLGGLTDPGGASGGLGGGDSALGGGDPGAAAGGLPGLGGGGLGGGSQGGGGGGRSPGQSGGQSAQQPNLGDLLGGALGGQESDTGGAAMPGMPVSSLDPRGSLGGGAGGGLGGGKPSAGAAGQNGQKTPSLDDLLGSLGGLQDAEVPGSPGETLGERLRSVLDPTGAHSGDPLNPSDGGPLDALGNPIGGQGGAPSLLDLLTSAGQDALQSLGDAIGNGLEAFGDFTEALTGVDPVEGLASQLRDLSQTPGLEGLGALADQIDPEGALAALEGGGGGGGGGGGDLSSAALAGGVGDGGPALDQPRQPDRFPRAALPAEAAAYGMPMDAASAATQGQPGQPGMAGSPGAGAGQGAAGGAGGYKRPKFLTSSDFIDEALGDTPFRVKPVIEP